MNSRQRICFALSGYQFPLVRMGHAGAIISGGKGKAEDKINALRSHGITVALNLGQLGKTALEVF